MIKKIALLFCLSICFVFCEEYEYEMAPPYLEEEFNFAPKDLFPLEEKPFVICIPSYNNKRYYKRNLDSVFAQNYSNYRIIYVDDASKDGTYDEVRNYIEERNCGDKILLWRNEKNKGAMYNHYRMAHACKDNEIYVSLDGDDWFAHKNVLRRLNQAYADSDVWVTYGSWVSFPYGKRGEDRELKTASLKEGIHRKIPFIWTQLRTFYAALFKKIPVELFQNDEGKFFSSACDVAYMFNIIDMASTHVYVIPDILYIYNIETEINDFKRDMKKQRFLEAMIRNREPLDEIDDWRVK
jgi:glycosyltransferase involved in cell wall biosynthesis